MVLAPTLSLLFVYFGYWLVCRLYGWRTTLSPSTFLMFFTFGTVGSVLFALYVEAIPLPFVTEQGTRFEQVNPVTWLTGPSIEEVAKILPLLGIVAFVPAARRLSLADFVLIGFTTGLGFGFVEANLVRVLSTDIASWGNVFAFGYATGTPQAQYLTYSTGHEVQPALVGLALGIGVRLWPDRHWKWLPGAAMLVFVAFDHSMWNFKQQHQYGSSFDLAPPFVEAAYRLTLHGFLGVVLLPAGLVVASFLEGRWSWRSVRSPDSLLLPDEHGGLLSEVRLLWGRRRLGSGAILRTLTYLRHRRAATLAAADAVNASSEAETGRFAELSRGRLMREREIVASPAPSPWLPSLKTCLAITRTVIHRYVVVLLVSLLMLLIFAVAPKYLPWLHQGLVASAIVLASAAYTVWRILKFVRERKPSPQSNDGETLVGYRARAMMLGASAVASAIPVLALGLNRQSLIFGAIAYIPQFAGEWTQGGGAMRVLMAGGGAATAAQPTTRKPPCEDLRREADAGADRVKALEANLDKLINGVSRGEARPVAENDQLNVDLDRNNRPIPNAPSGPSGGAAPPDNVIANVGRYAPPDNPAADLARQFLQTAPSLGNGPSAAPINPVQAGSEPVVIPAKSPLDGLIDRSRLIPLGDPRSAAIADVAGAPAAGEPGSAMPLSIPGKISGSPTSPSPGRQADWLKGFKSAPGLKTVPLGWTDAPPMPEPIKLPPGTPDIEDIQRAEAALEAERAAQEKRIAALSLCLSQAAAKDKPVADTLDGLQKAFDDAKRAYDQAQADLNQAMKEGVKSLADFNRAYNDLWNKAIGRLDDYIKGHSALAKPLADLWKDRAMNERIKNFAEGVDMLSGAAQLGNGLLKQSLAAEAKALAPELEGAGSKLAADAAKLDQEAAAAESAAKRELAAAEEPHAAPKREPLKVEEWDPHAPDLHDVPAPNPSTHFVDANGNVTNQPLLQPGQAGQRTLDRLLDGYSSTQNKIYTDTVNNYAQKMINGQFSWNAIPEGERIVLDGNTIMSGHHRFAAAELAAEATGRPLMNAPNAIIPAEGFATAEVAQKTVSAGVRDPRPWSQVGVVPGAQPARPVQTVDDELRAIRDATNEPHPE